MTGETAVDRLIERLTARLLARRVPRGHWEGHLASSALATATAVVAMEMAGRHGVSGYEALAAGGTAWLARTQNADGGWGDTVRSRSNLSTSLLVWAALSLRRERLASDVAPDVQEGAERYLRAVVGVLTPTRIRDAIIARYGSDRTFSVPILTVLAMSGRLGDPRDAWRLVPQLPFELAACPHQWFQWLRLPVVSYALPALIAIGQVRHHHRPTRLLPLRALRDRLARPTRDTLLAMQPASGGYLEATPLTAFVVMSLVSADQADHPVVANGLRFIEQSSREDGSWPIDTNLATWATTLAVNAWREVPPEVDRGLVAEWILDQQHRVEHPFTHAAPGGWAWTDLSGGVPDADDTAGALVALAHLAPGEPRVVEAARHGVEWLLGLQNSDGGIPTFCRGWGALPFDRSAPDLTAHAVQAWLAWRPALPPVLGERASRALGRATAYLAAQQRPDGSWVPLWFGNEQAPEEENPVYGTARVLAALAVLPEPGREVERARERGLEWLLAAQNADGGWGGASGCRSSLEETGVALQAVARCVKAGGRDAPRASLARAVAFLEAATEGGTRIEAAPIGLYFARLWYYEELYPAIFVLAGLTEVNRDRGQILNASKMLAFKI